MIMSKRITTLAALPVLLALLAAPGFGQQEKPAAFNANLEHAKTSKVIGTTVKNKEHETLGSIQDLVFNTDGRISYAVLSFGGFLGLGDKYFAVPWGSLSAASDSFFVLDVDKDRLRSAPGFDKSSWPNMANSEWSTEVDRFYKNEVPLDRSWGGKADTLDSAAVRNASGTKLGTVRDIVLDLDRGRAVLLVVRTESNVEPKGCCVAIPWSAMTVVPEKDTFTLNATESVLGQAPSFADDKWPEMDRAYTARAFDHFGVSRDGVAPVTARDTVTPVTPSNTMPAPKALGNCCRTTEMVGAKWRSTSDDSRGTVKDLVVRDDLGTVTFVICEMTDGSGKLLAIPWSVCRYTKADGWTVTCDTAMLKSAPTFPGKQWPDFNDPSFRERINTHFGVKKTDPAIGLGQ